MEYIETMGLVYAEGQKAKVQTATFDMRAIICHFVESK